MNHFFNLVYNNILIVLKSVSGKIFFLAAIGLIVFSSLVTIDGVGPRAIIIVGSMPVPLIMFETIFSAFDITLGILVIFMAINLAEFMINGNLMHVFISRNKNRINYLSSVFTSLLILVTIGFLGYGLLYTRAGFDLNLIFWAYLGKALVYFSIALILVTLLNIQQTRKMAVLYFILLFMILPMALGSLGNFVSTNTLLVGFVDLLNTFFSVHFLFSDFKDQVIIREYLNFGVLLKASLVMILLLVGNIALFNKRDLA